MKPILVGILVAVFLSPIAAMSDGVEDHPFIKTGSWWNLYFSSDDNPLERGGGSIHAVKIIDLDESRPSWVRITFPRNREDHFSIFGPAAKAKGNDDVSFDEAVAEWESTISEWKTMWVNLRFVVSMTQIVEDGGGNK